MSDHADGTKILPGGSMFMWEREREREREVNTYKFCNRCAVNTNQINEYVLILTNTAIPVERLL